MPIKNRVSALMGERRESIQALADATGIAYSTAFRLYHDKADRIEFRTLALLCAHYGVTPDKILEWMPEELSHAKINNF